MQRYRSVAKDQTALRMRLRDLAAARVRYGERRLHVLLQRDGWHVNHTRVDRLAPLGRARGAAQAGANTCQRRARGPTAGTAAE